MESSSALVTVQQYTTQSPSATHRPARGQDWGPARQLQGFGGVGGGGGGGAGTFSTINPPHSSSQSTQALALTGSYIYYKYSSFALRLQTSQHLILDLLYLKQ